MQNEELLQISGFGEVKLARYGAIFMDVIRSYALEHNLTSRIAQKAPKRERPKIPSVKESLSAADTRSATRRETLELFKSGHPITEIAAMRKKSVNTIEEHLAAFVYSGELPVRSVMSAERLAQILPVIETKGHMALKPIKEALPEEVSYADIRIAIAHWERMREG